MHVFLTGKRQAGKSTAIKRIAELLGCRTVGFQTLFTDRFDQNKALYMLPAFSQRPPTEADIVTQFIADKPHPLTERFDSIGGRLLKEAQTKRDALIIMDECSRFEKDAVLFQREIFSCLDGGLPVLGVVRENAGGWVERIREHRNVRLITVSAENRDAVPLEAAAYLRGESRE